MPRASSDVIVACLDDIRAGRRTLDQCVRDHPEAAAELRELASVALAVRPDDSLHLDETARLRGRAQLLAAISHNGHHAAEDRRMFGVRAVVGLPPRWLGAIGAALSALAAGGAVVYAAQGAPPDSPLYPVQQAVQVVAAVVAPATPTPSPTPSPTAVPVLSVPPPAQQAVAQPTAVPPTPVPTPRSVPSSRASLAPTASVRGEGDRGDNGRGQQDDAKDQKGGNGRGNGGGGAQRAEDRRVATVATPRTSATPTPSASGDRHGGDDGEGGDHHGGDGGGGGRR